MPTIAYLLAWPSLSRIGAASTCAHRCSVALTKLLSSILVSLQRLITSWDYEVLLRIGVIVLGHCNIALFQLYIGLFGVVVSSLLRSAQSTVK